MKWYVLLLSIFYFSACNELLTDHTNKKLMCTTISDTANTLVTFSNYKKYHTDRNTTVEILKSFLNNCLCDSVHGKYFANTFLCTISDGRRYGDTILVFSLCNFVPEILTADYDKPFIGWQELDTVKNSINLPAAVFTNADSDVLNRNYEYTIGTIFNVYDD